MRERPERLLTDFFYPIVERIDPALVPELLWLDLAARFATDNPYALTGGSPMSLLVSHVAWYDRNVAAALFEPTRVVLQAATSGDSGASSSDFVAWSLFDPRAAVACLEKLPLRAGRDARLAVAQSMARSHEERWREIWRDWTVILDGARQER